jgi:hypothetical protein
MDKLIDIPASYITVKMAMTLLSMVTFNKETKKTTHHCELL